MRAVPLLSRYNYRIHVDAYMNGTELLIVCSKHTDARLDTMFNTEAQFRTVVSHVIVVLGDQNLTPALHTASSIKMF
jgi:hypothetical protein